MSIKSMLDKVNISDVPAAGQVRKAVAKTAPGRLIQFGNELEEAERKLAEYDGALPTKRLDSKRIRPSALRNRHEDSFVGDVWIQFKRDIAAAGGNTQAIKVRPISDDKNARIAHAVRSNRAQVMFPKGHLRSR